MTANETFFSFDRVENEMVNDRVQSRMKHIKVVHYNNCELAECRLSANADHSFIHLSTIYSSIWWCLFVVSSFCLEMPWKHISVDYNTKCSNANRFVGSLEAILFLVCLFPTLPHLTDSHQLRSLPHAYSVCVYGAPSLILDYITRGFPLSTHI